LDTDWVSRTIKIYWVDKLPNPDKDIN